MIKPNGKYDAENWKALFRTRAKYESSSWNYCWFDTWFHMQGSVKEPRSVFSIWRKSPSTPKTRKQLLQCWSFLWFRAHKTVIWLGSGKYWSCPWLLLCWFKGLSTLPWLTEHLNLIPHFIWPANNNFWSGTIQLMRFNYNVLFPSRANQPCILIHLSFSHPEEALPSGE